MNADALCKRVDAVNALLESCGDFSGTVGQAQANVLVKEVRKARLSPESLQQVLGAVNASRFNDSEKKHRWSMRSPRLRQRGRQAVSRLWPRRRGSR